MIKVKRDPKKKKAASGLLSTPGAGKASKEGRPIGEGFRHKKKGPLQEEGRGRGCRRSWWLDLTALADIDSGREAGSRSVSQKKTVLQRLPGVGPPLSVLGSAQCEGGSSGRMLLEKGKVHKRQGGALVMAKKEVTYRIAT